MTALETIDMLINRAFGEGQEDVRRALLTVKEAMVAEEDSLREALARSTGLAQALLFHAGRVIREREADLEKLDALERSIADLSHPNLRLLLDERDAARKAAMPICIGRSIIGRLARDGQWVSESGAAVIAADELFRNDPYDQLAAMTAERDALREMVTVREENIEWQYQNKLKQVAILTSERDGWKASFQNENTRLQHCQKACDAYIAERDDYKAKWLAACDEIIHQGKQVKAITAERDLDEAFALIEDCPLLFTTTCNVGEKAWIERAKEALDGRAA